MITTYIRKDYVVFFVILLINTALSIGAVYFINREALHCENQLNICNSTLEACNYELSTANEKYMRAVEELNSLKLTNKELQFLISKCQN